MNIIIHGPQGCGKSGNAQRLATLFGCSKIIEEPDTTKLPSPFARHLYLTSRSEIPMTWLEKAIVFSFDEAMSLLNITKTHPEFIDFSFPSKPSDGRMHAFRPAQWGGTTAISLEYGSLGLTFVTCEMSLDRLLLSVESARHLHLSLGWALDHYNKRMVSHSEMLSGMPNLDVSPQDAPNV